MKNARSGSLRSISTGISLDMVSLRSSQVPYRCMFFQYTTAAMVLAEARMRKAAINSRRAERIS